jgi:3-oxoacyl-[acyl-carrier protein] reductase
MGERSNFFITGCASGIGKHLTSVLLNQGKKVYATDINFEGLEAAAKEAGWPSDRVWLEKLDVRSNDEWQAVFPRAVEAMGFVDCIINNSGILKAFWCHETPADIVDLMLDVNVKGVMFGTQVAAAHMIERKNGHVINIASMAGMAPITGQSVYSGSKYAVRGYTLACAAELSKHGVACTAICPSGVQTPLFAGQEQDEAAAMLFVEKNLLTVEDIEWAILKKAIPGEPLEVALPFKLAIQARFANMFPWLGKVLGPLYMNKGRKNQLRSV